MFAKHRFILEKGSSPPPDEEIEKEVNSVIDAAVVSQEITPFVELEGSPVLVPVYVAKNDSMFEQEFVSGPVEVSPEFYNLAREAGFCELSELPSGFAERPSLEVIRAAGWHGGQETEYPIIYLDDFLFHKSCYPTLAIKLDMSGEHLKIPSMRTREDPMAAILKQFLDDQIEPKTVANAWKFILDDPYFDEKENEIVFSSFSGKPISVNRKALSARLRRLKSSLPK